MGRILNLGPSLDPIQVNLGVLHYWGVHFRWGPYYFMTDHNPVIISNYYYCSGWRGDLNAYKDSHDTMVFALAGFDGSESAVVRHEPASPGHEGCSDTLRQVPGTGIPEEDVEGGPRCGRQLETTPGCCQLSEEKSSLDEMN